MVHKLMKWYKIRFTEKNYDETYIAHNREEAIRKFKQNRPDKKIISIKRVV